MISLLLHDENNDAEAKGAQQQRGSAERDYRFITAALPSLVVPLVCRFFFSGLSVVTFRLSQAEKCVHHPKTSPPADSLLTCVICPRLASSSTSTLRLSDFQYITLSEISHSGKGRLCQWSPSGTLEGPLTHLPPVAAQTTPPSLLQTPPVLPSSLCLATASIVNMNENKGRE